MNNDGHVDLVIGAPGHGSLGNHMQGRVYIVYGRLNVFKQTAIFENLFNIW